MAIEDTIAAIATGLTDSGIGIIRISGENAIEVGNRIFQSPLGEKILHQAENRKMYYGFAADEEQDFVIDEVLAVVMRAPNSFTGENTVEIQCHGGILVMRKILETALKSGARMAEPGEFTKRAFLNGKMDLSRAEAVMDVIGSRNEFALASSVNQLKGMLSEKIKKYRAEILYEVAFIESALDDPEHISLDGYPERLEEKIAGLTESIERLIATAEDGRWVKEGINTVILGKPNVGKSSLLNYLAGEERAIVTEVAGTTRDILQESIRLGNISLNVTDTAGIHKTEDTVEKIGVKKAVEYAKDADLILYMADGSMELNENDKEIVSILKNKKVIVLLNKSDLENVVTESMVRKLFSEMSGQKEFAIVRTSVKNGGGMEELERTIREMFFQGELKCSHEVMITSLRHKKALEECRDSLHQVRRSIENGMPEDFFSIDLMNAYASLGRIIGEEVDDDLVDEIFSRFCMGK